ncbi:chloride channel protein [Terriglobus aquaticus]|uniref:Chloride channel protein n=1 Tax=Terriglobus aquaticus TaxID=940139 RepID=A0ABW9KIB0_9BACT|nr:chloride channel protein [Terriglobus aquaticus]
MLRNYLAPDFKRSLLALPQYLVRWVPIAGIAGILAGAASALLIWSLNQATRIRESHLWLIALLPLAGLVEGLLYLYIGRDVSGGNNLIFEQIQQPTRRLQFRMTPLILLTTFMTHLFGGSAGREGTALQTGASLADQLTRPFRLDERGRRILLMAGLSAGFGSVFGAPLAGAVFGMEVLAIGSVSYDAILPCFVASLIGNITTSALTEHEAAFRVGYVPYLNVRTLVLAAIAGAIFGAVGLAFSWIAHQIELFFKNHVRYVPMRPFFGGVLVALAAAAIHSTRYLGLGARPIVEAFALRVSPWDWLGKLLFTALTLGAGFKGGEVTPLFFVGATLGNALSRFIALPMPLLAAMGFVGVFAGAANTPIASTLLAMELFGAEAGSFAAIACIFSYLFSGHSGIYRTQRVQVNKYGVITEVPANTITHPEDAIHPQHDNVQI